MTDTARHHGEDGRLDVAETAALLADLAELTARASQAQAEAAVLAGRLAQYGRVEQVEGLPLDMVLILQSRLHPSDARFQVTAGEVLAHMPVLAGLLQAGKVSWSVARQIVWQVRSFGSAVRGQVDQRLAATVHAGDIEALDPEGLVWAVEQAVLDVRDARRVERAEAKVVRENFVAVQADFDGGIRGHFRFDPVAGAIVLNALEDAAEHISRANQADDDPDDFDADADENDAVVATDVTETGGGGPRPGDTGCGGGPGTGDAERGGARDVDGDAHDASATDGDSGSDAVHASDGHGGGHAHGTSAGANDSHDDRHGHHADGLHGDAASDGGGHADHDPGEADGGWRPDTGRARQFGVALTRLAQCWLAGGRDAKPKPAFVAHVDVGDVRVNAAGRVELNVRGAIPTITLAALAQLEGDATLRTVLFDGARPLATARKRTAVNIPRDVRFAVKARDEGCRFPGSTDPVGFGDVHHLIHEEHGGDHLPENLAVLSRRWHTTAHRHDWTLTLDPDDGAVTATRRDKSYTSLPPGTQLARPQSCACRAPQRPPDPPATGPPPRPRRVPPRTPTTDPPPRGNGTRRADGRTERPPPRGTDTPGPPPARPDPPLPF